MIKFSLIIGFLISVSLMFSCVPPCNEPDHTFQVNEQFLPERDSISIGDTLWLNCSIPKLLIDINSGQKITFSNPDKLGANIIISNIINFKDSNRGAIDDFSYINKIGNIYLDPSNGESKNVMQLSFQDTNDTYVLQVGLIAKVSGLFAFTIPDASNISRNHNYKCGLSTFHILNSNANNNLSIFTKTWEERLSTYDSLRTYCVKVK